MESSLLLIKDIMKALRGVKLKSHCGNMRRKYRIAGTTLQSTIELRVPIDDQGTMKSVIDSFKETYGFIINYTRLPCLQVGNPLRPNYLPMETVRQNNYNNDKYAEEFGIKICDQLAVVEARVLLALRGKGLPSTSWSMEHEEQDQVERVLKARFHVALAKLQPQSKKLDLLVLILPDVNGPLYGDIKRICERDLGVISQCCLAKHAYKKNPQYLANVALKINVKVGGRNTVLMDAISGRIPLLSGVPTIIFWCRCHPSSSGRRCRCFSRLARGHKICWFSLRSGTPSRAPFFL